VAYFVTLTPATEKAVGKFPKEVRTRIADRLVELATNPRPPGCVKLTGEDAYRIRVGDYRIIYAIHDDRLIVLVIDVGHRREVYRRR
jgi:mRNA interferase RelE/StbE